MERFTLSPEYEITCEWKKTRNGFCHKAKLHKNSLIVAHAREGYLNRTWESYDYQTVIHKLIQAYFGKEDATAYCQLVDAQGKGKINKELVFLAGLCKLGELLTDNKEGQNNWKKRMLNTQLGIDFPDDFDQLPEEEKEKRLNKAINVLEEKHK